MKPAAWIPADYTCVFFPCNQAMYTYYITVPNLSFECNYMLSSMSPSSNSLNVGGGLEDQKKSYLNRQHTKEDVQMVNKHIKRCLTSLVIMQIPWICSGI